MLSQQFLTSGSKSRPLLSSSQVRLSSLRLCPSQQLQEHFGRKACLLEDMRQSGSFDGPMCRNNQLQDFIGKVFVKPNVAPFLTDHDPAVTLKGSDNAIVPETGDFGHRVIRTVSALAIVETSSSTGSR